MDIVLLVKGTAKEGTRPEVEISYLVTLGVPEVARVHR